MRRREREVARLASSCGAELVGRTGGGHLLILRPDGRRVVASATPSDWRDLRNLEAKLTRGGAR